MVDYFLLLTFTLRIDEYIVGSTKETLILDE
jgi:hypothetical protein